MERTVPSQILSRNDTSANWSSVNPILKKGELGIEIATDNSTYIKVGDGVTHWNDLDYTLNMYITNLDTKICNY